MAAACLRYTSPTSGDFRSVPRLGSEAPAVPESLASLRAPVGGAGRRSHRALHDRGLPAPRRPGLPRGGREHRAAPRARGPDADQSILFREPDEPAALPSGLEPDLRDGAGRRRDPRRRAPAARADRRALQHAPARRDPEERGNLLPGPPRARPRNGSGSAHEGGLGGLERRGAGGRAARAAAHRRGKAALSRRLLERRRALGQVRARRRRGREPPARRTDHPHVADDRRHAGRRASRSTSAASR